MDCNIFCRPSRKIVARYVNRYRWKRVSMKSADQKY